MSYFYILTWTSTAIDTVALAFKIRKSKTVDKAKPCKDFPLMPDMILPLFKISRTVFQAQEEDRKILRK